MKFCNSCLTFKPENEGKKLIRGKATIWRCSACIERRKGKT